MKPIIEPYKGRGVREDEHVKAYRNLHNGTWSLVPTSGPYKGLVAAHAVQAGLWHPELRVSESGRQRVIRDGKKNVHAYVVGRLATYIPENTLLSLRKRLSYNPFQHPAFRFAGPGGLQDAHKAGYIELDAQGRAFAYNPR